MKQLRPSVMVQKEWFKPPALEWKKIRQSILNRDDYTCTYCHLVATTFMQVNHIGAEDDHSPENLETVCKACHSVLHMGINASQGYLTVFESEEHIQNIAAIVAHTRLLVAKDTSWQSIEEIIFTRFGKPGGKRFSAGESVNWANKVLASIEPSKYREYLPAGYAVMFHQAGEWQGYPEKIHRWQCVEGAHYRKGVL